MASGVGAVVLAAAVLCLSGCANLGYYWQSATGHLKVMQAAKPVEEWLGDAAAPQRLKDKLALSQRIRAFASRELRLPDNPSYRRYADLQRTAVVWNVVAAPEFSIKLKTWCFPFTGCVGYRGYFNEAEAKAEAARLAADGLESSVYPVPAYSTLGWMNWAGGDPLLNTFINYPDAELARLVFHELAHQLVYVRDDTTFNESFAVAVEQEGVRRWLESQGRPAELADFHAAQTRKREFAERVTQARERLAAAYAMDISREAKLEHKRGEWERLRVSYPALPAEPNNAFLASIAVYTELVPVFEQLLAESGSLEAFYKRVKSLARDPSTREAYFTKAGYRRSS